MENLIEAIRQAPSILLTTHRQCDGDGLGAELALYYALRKIGKQIRIVNVDETPRKYRFLNPDFHITYFSEQPDLVVNADLCLIFDTNDERLLEPLFSKMIKPHCRSVAFVDHHPVLENGPQPSALSLIETSSASTGELVYRMIKALGISLDTDIAKCLYTSITFDTQLYRYIRNSPVSHRIAAELLEFDIDVPTIHRHLFGHQTVQKFAFLAKTLGQIEYFCDGQLAVVRVLDEDLFRYNLDVDESRDVIDMVMNIESLEAAVLFREDQPGAYKVSLRSKGQIKVHTVAEMLGGGGHMHAAGAFVKNTDYAQLKQKVVSEISKRLSVAGI